MRGGKWIAAVALALSITVFSGFGPAALAQGPGRPEKPLGKYGWCFKPPRFQIYNAPGQYGGLMMVDNHTGETYQRIIVATPDGIDIRWLKIERHKKLKSGEAIQW